MLGKFEGRREKGMTEDEMVGEHHQLNGHEFEQDLELIIDRIDGCAAIHGVPKSQIPLSY